MPLCVMHRAAMLETYGIKRAYVETCLTCSAAEAKKAEQAAQKRKDYVGSIYYLDVGGTIKIGWTANMESRMRAYPPDSVLLAVEHGTRAIERARHSLFNEYLAHGREWFEPGEHLKDWIAQLRKRNGAPTEMPRRSTPEKAAMPSNLKTRYSSYRPRKHDGSAAVKRSAA